MKLLTLVPVTLVLVLRSCSGQEENHTPVIGRKGTKCYDDFNRPQRCIPEFENAAFNVLMEATNTCGQNGEIEYCVQTGVTSRKSCEICYPQQHDARYLTDFHKNDNPTWWQSETMYEGIQYPNQVNLTLKFGKAFDITYVRLLFNSPRPESFYISKKTSENGPWIPYQYYSATCRDTYGLPDTTHTARGEETRALCTSEYADISPLRGGNVAFGTLEGRPSAYNFDSSPELQNWVTATEIMITLDRLNTFGDEIFGDIQVLRSYFYAIADVAVGARCKCNGHASECITSTGVDGSRRRVCQCEHNTAGPDCNECLPFYNDAPWARATAKNAHECKQCNCNGYSNRCYFDQQLYEQTGHGGHCLDCSANRDGPNCEHCKENFYMREDGFCVACECNEVGSLSLQCNSEGKCMCKPGVTGEKCDRCDINHYDFSPQGCKNCSCSIEGSANNQPNCDPYSGVCFCKENVEGKRCRECKPGFFNLDIENEFGCTPCFCYGHSAQCSSALGYAKYVLESTFAKSAERWRAADAYGRNVEIKYDGITQSIGVHAMGDETIFFLAPDRFLGDQRKSYNQLLQFSLRIGDNRAVPTATDIILEGDGKSVTNTIFAQNNLPPTIQRQEYSFRLHEQSWQPRLNARDFISILTNLTAIKIRGTYGPHGQGYVDDVKLETAAQVAGLPAMWVEQCECPVGYVGQFCESCAPGFRHSPAQGSPFMPCIPCDCNKHADICDSESGKCICHHNTAGDNCELCARGYYGNALGGTPNDCLPCNCPNGGACIQVDEETIMCTECPVGYTGHRCDSCSDGYYGDPNNGIPCQACECNLNIDQNAIGNCNTTTGECLKCIHNTGGPQCDQCLPGYWGNALVLPKGDCKPCECNRLGTEINKEFAPVCDQSSGVCACKPHVVGKNCDQCEDGYYNINSGEGCDSCNCDPIGSYNQTCNLYTGQCYCRPGVTGLRCDHCQVRKYGFSLEGCKDCDCDRIGSKDLQCDPNGQCPCLDNVEGRRCDRCKENKYDRQRGCVDCPDCYNLVQKESRQHTTKLNRLAEILDEIERRPTVISDDKFPEELEKLQNEIDDFHDKVKKTTGEDSLIDQVEDIRNREKEISRTLSAIDENIFTASNKTQAAEQKLTNTEELLKAAQNDLEKAFNDFEFQGKEALENAWKRAETVGQQSDKMTSIAHEARELADELDEQADALVNTAKEAKNKSIEAYEKVVKATNKQNEINDEARQLRNELNTIEFKLNDTRRRTKEVSDEAKETKKQALELLNEVNNLVIPDININKLRKKAKKLENEAAELRIKAEKYYEGYDKLVQEVMDRYNTGSDLLQKSKEQEEATNELYNDFQIYKTQADKAVDLGNQLLNETENIYKLLRDFDSQTQKNKQEAEEALKSIDDIENIIQETFAKAYDAGSTLAESKTNANQALTTAKEADRLAKNASKNAEVLKNEATALKQNASALKNEAVLMFDRVLDTENELKNLLDQTQNNNSIVEQAKEKVGRAGKETDEASKKVQELMTDVQEILNALENSADIDEESLNRLEEQIKQVEEKVIESNLDEKLKQLQKEHKSQAELIEQYNREIAFLQGEVQNIEEIVHALPDGCFRKVELEP